MRVLVTGAYGFYGLNLVQYLLGQEDVEAVYGIDNFSRGSVALGAVSEFIHDSKFNLIYGNYQDLTVKQINNMAVDVVYHLAGYISGEESMETSEEYFLNNEYGLLRLLNTLLHTKNRPCLVFASTVETAGVTGSQSCAAAMQPLTVLTASKIAGESYCRAFFDWYHYPVIIVRNTNTYGENQNLHGYSGAIPIFIKKALQDEPLIIYNNGEQTRDFLYIEDVVRAYALLRESRDELIGQTLYFYSGETVTINNLAFLIKDLIESSSEIIHLPGRTGTIPEQPAEIFRISDVVSWEPLVNLREGLAKTIAWQKGAVKQYA